MSASLGRGHPAGILACSRRASGSGSRGPRGAPALGVRLALPCRPGAGSDWGRRSRVQGRAGTGDEAEAGSGSAVAAPAESGDFLRGAGGGGAATPGRAPAAGAGLAPRWGGVGRAGHGRGEEGQWWPDGAGGAPPL